MNNECVIYEGYKNSCGYGVIKYKGKARLAHRLAYAAHHNIELDSLVGEVMHSCDNPPCINHKHLRLGTHAENMADMALKGRAAHTVMYGESNGNVTLSDNDVVYIKANAVKGWPSKGGNITAIALKFNVSRQQVHNILNGKMRIDKDVEDVT